MINDFRIEGILNEGQIVILSCHYALQCIGIVLEFQII